MQQRLLALVFGTALVVALGVALVSTPQRANGEVQAAARMQASPVTATVAVPVEDGTGCCAGNVANCPMEKVAAPAPEGSASCCAGDMSDCPMDKGAAATADDAELEPLATREAMPPDSE